MRTILTLLASSLFIFFATVSVSQQNLVDVEGQVKIRGSIDINHADDSTSVFIGRNSGVNVDFTTDRSNTFVGSSAGFSNTTGSASLLRKICRHE